MPLPIRPNIRQMTPYSPGKPISEVQRELGLSDVVKLASNENPLGPSPLALQAVREAASQIHLYPDGGAFELKQALSAHFDVPQEQIVLGNGSDEVIRMLGWVLLDKPEDEVLCGDPSFICYDEAAHMVPCKLVKVPLDSNYVHDLPAMARALSDRTRIVFIANPNNPTGTIVRRMEVEAFLKDVPDTALTVLDEAYFEFAVGVPGYPDGRLYVLEGRNVASLRTFSKAYGLAGLRCGYGFVPLEVADAIQRSRQPFNVNSLAQVAGIAALQDQEHVQRTLQNNQEGAERISQALSKSGAKTCETYANFVFADLGRPSQPLVEALLGQGVIVRSGAPFKCANCIRVTIGTSKEVDKFISALENSTVEAGR
jgi:histidinol-phosphate aminotransferase